MASDPTTSSVALTRLEASIMGESALIDREHGRVLWEAGGSAVGRLSASVAPKLDELGAAHIKAKVLTSLLLIAVSRMMLKRLQTKLHGTRVANEFLRIRFVGPFIVLLAKMTILRIPSPSPWVIFLLWVLYILEAYTCSTREFLSHKICSPDDIEQYIESLRKEVPEVSWNVRCFHYEGYSLPKLSQVLAVALRKRNISADDSRVEIDSKEASFSRIRRKVVTSQAVGSYQLRHCIDKTIAGIWKRAPLFSETGAPFTKLVLSKLLVLSDGKTRQDYMRQQGRFVSEHGQQDENAEFSTNIHVPGFRRRILAAQPTRGVTSFFRLSTFWIATLLLLTVPYRVWFSNHCDEVRVTVVKEIYLQGPKQDASRNRGWLFSLYSSNNSTDSLENEHFRDIMRKVRLYRSSKELVSPLVDDDSQINATLGHDEANST